MCEKLHEAGGEVEIKMQRELKNKAQEIMDDWRRKKQEVERPLKALSQDLKARWESALADRGLANRWPALLDSFLQRESALEPLPALKTQFAKILGQNHTPLAKWLNLDILTWEAYQVSAVMAPEPHLLLDDEWPSTLLISGGEILARWLIQKHMPPGQLHLAAEKIESEFFSLHKERLELRTELEIGPIEKTIGALQGRGQSDLFMTVMVFDVKNTLKGKIQFHFDLKWTGLLK